MSETFKALAKDDYISEPYIAKASQQYYVISGSIDNPTQVTIDIADEPPAGWPAADADFGFINAETGHGAYLLWKSVQQTVYTPSGNIEEVYAFTPSGSSYVVSLGMDAAGDGVYPGSFVFGIKGVSDTIVDDRVGNLYFAGSPTNVLGSIDYKQGIAVILRNSAGSDGTIHSSSGVKLGTNVSASVGFKSTTTIYRHTVFARLMPRDFNFSLNPSAQIKVSYFDSGSGNTVTGSLAYDMFDSGGLTPYVTTVGMYDQQYNLVAVAKLPNPVPRTSLSEQTFVIKFDT